MRVALVAVAAMAGLLQARAARADGFFEVVTGIAVPIAEDEYADGNDESFKLGLRAGSMPERRGGIEFGFDWTPVNNDLDSDTLDIDVHRFRALIGGRFGGRVARRARAFARVGAGVDLVDVSADFRAGPISAEADERDVGLALELGGGIAVDVGRIEIGGQLAIPFAFHFDDDDPNDNTDFDLDYTGIDLDFLAFISFKI